MMLFKKFADQVLRKQFAAARHTVLAELRSLVATRGDIIEFEITPGPAGLDALCTSQKKIWRQDVRSEFARLCGFSIAAVCLACVAVLSIVRLDGAVVRCAAIIALGVAIYWVQGKLWRSCSGLRTKVNQGYKSASLDVFTNHGRSIWLVGSRGVYVALNAVDHTAPQCEFLPFPEIGDVTISRFEGETLVSLWSSAGRLVRVMIFPGQTIDNTPDLNGLVTRAHRSPMVEIGVATA